MSTVRKVRRAVSLGIALAMVSGLLLVNTASPASAGLSSCSPTRPERPPIARGLAGCDLIVFADAYSGDLWLTDELGSEPIRLTNTPAIEDNPAGVFPWIFYDVTPAGGGKRDIWMMSLLGAGRIKVTGLRSDDFQPFAQVAYGMATPEEPDPSVPSVRGPGIFYPIILGYTSNRLMGKKGLRRCGYELFGELFTITGPELLTPCNRTDKIDGEFSLDIEELAYTGFPWTTFEPDIHLTDGTTDSMVTSNGRSFEASWAPDPTTLRPREAAGSTELTYTKFGDHGELFNIMSDGTGDTLFAAPPSESVNYWGAEWQLYGERLLVVRGTPKRSTVATLMPDGSSPMIVTDPLEFWVTNADFVTPFSIV